MRIRRILWRPRPFLGGGYYVSTDPIFSLSDAGPSPVPAAAQMEQPPGKTPTPTPIASTITVVPTMGLPIPIATQTSSTASPTAAPMACPAGQGWNATTATCTWQTNTQAGCTGSGGVWDAIKMLCSAPPPVIGSILPINGSTGTTVSITGTGFQNGASVAFGGITSTNVVVGSATAITCAVPPQATAAAGAAASATPVGAVTVNLTVTNPDGGQAALANAFTYSIPTLGQPGYTPTTCQTGYSMNWNGSACVPTPGPSTLDPSICAPGQAMQNNACISTSDPNYVPMTALSTTVSPATAATTTGVITTPEVPSATPDNMSPVLQMMQQMQAMAQMQQQAAMQQASVTSPSYATYPSPKPKPKAKPKARPAQSGQIMGMDIKTVGLIVASTAAVVLLLRK